MRSKILKCGLRRVLFGGFQLSSLQTIALKFSIVMFRPVRPLVEKGCGVAPARGDRSEHPFGIGQYSGRRVALAPRKDSVRAQPQNIAGGQVGHTHCTARRCGAGGAAADQHRSQGSVQVGGLGQNRLRQIVG